MSKKLDPDVKALRATARALEQSSSIRMLLINLEYIWSRYTDPHVQRELARRMPQQ